MTAEEPTSRSKPPQQKPSQTPKGIFTFIVILALIVTGYLLCILLGSLVINSPSYQQVSEQLSLYARPYIGGLIILAGITLPALIWRRQKHLPTLQKIFACLPPSLCVISFGLAAISPAFGVLPCITAITLSVWYVAMAAINQKMNPPHYSAIIQLFQNGRYEEALKYANRSIENSPNHWKAYQARAAIYCSLREWAKAEQDARRALTLKPGSAEVMETLGCALIQQASYEQVLAVLIPAIELLPKNGLIAAMLGKAQYRLGKYNEAAKSFDLALKRNLAPNVRKLTASYFWASSLEKSGQIEEAQQAYEAMSQFQRYLVDLDKTYQITSGPEDALMITDVAEIKRRLGIPEIGAA